MPSKVVPSKNRTLVTDPLELLADAVMVTIAGAMKVAPFVGAIRVTAGGVLETTDTMTGADVLVPPKLSNAFAVRV